MEIRWTIVEGKWQPNWFEKNLPFFQILKYFLIVALILLVVSKLEPILFENNENNNYEDDYSCYYTGPVEVCG